MNRCVYYGSSETLSGVQRLHERGGADTVRTESRDIAARSRVQETSRFEPTETRAETKGQAFRFGPRGKRPRLVQPRFARLAGKLGIGEALALQSSRRRC
jgi:hypothetical protein